VPTRLSSLAIQIEAIGVDKVKSALREVGGEAETQSRRLRLVSGGANEVADKFGLATRAVAKFSDELAEQGKVSGRNLRSLIGEISSLGFAFGPYGELVAGVAIGGAAIYHLFERTREEIDKTQQKFKDSLADMINTGNTVGLQTQLRNLEKGTPANDFQDAIKPKLVQIELLKKYQSSLGEGKIWLSMTAKKQFDELMADENVKKYFILREAILNPKTGVLPEISLQTVKIEAAKAGPIEAPVPQVRGQMPGVGLGSSTAGGNAQLGPVAPPDDRILEAYKKKIAADAQAIIDQAKAVGAMIRTGLADTLSKSIYDGFSAAFSGKGLGGIFKAFGKTVLAGLGSIFGELGQTYIRYGIMMSALGDALWNPFTSGPAAIAIGAALIALSAALGATAHGSGGGGSSPNFTARVAEVTNVKLVATSVADQARYDPRGMNMTVIGPGDPVAFRQIQQGLDNHGRR
jgi:hypothetical protein